MRKRSRAPLMYVKDTGKEFLLEVELPGILKENVSIELTEDTVEITGTRKEEEDVDDHEYLRRERIYSSWIRKLTLPEEIVEQKAQASYEDGVLILVLPKKEPKEKAKKHKVEIK